GDAARRDQTHFYRLDVRCQPRPARGRASDLRRVGDRLQRREKSQRGRSTARSADRTQATGAPGAAQAFAAATRAAAGIFAAATLAKLRECFLAADRAVDCERDRKS